MIKLSILLTLFFGFSNSILCQIKSEKQVFYRLIKDSSERRFHNNSSKDSCVMFWNEYTMNGNVEIEYDFPSDRCWKKNGPWEHHYQYDAKNRILKRKTYGGLEGKERTLMSVRLYSYLDTNNLWMANENKIIYNYRAIIPSDKKTIDTTYSKIINTQGLYPIVEAKISFDTIITEQGTFHFNNANQYQDELFNLALVEKLTQYKTVKDFEIALKTNIDSLTNNLKTIHSIHNFHSCEFTFHENNNRREISFQTLENFIYIEYKFLNEKGDEYLSYYYQYYLRGQTLRKDGFMKTFLQYY